MNEIVARKKGVRLSAQKARLVVDKIRGLSVDKASSLLAHMPKKAADFVEATLRSAVANAEHNFAADVDRLFVKSIFVDQGQTLKRTMPRAKGRADRISKPSCNITVIVSEN